MEWYGGMVWQVTHFGHCVVYTLGTGLEFIVKALPLTPHTESFLAPTVSFNEPASLCGSPLMESFLCASHSVVLPGKMEFSLETSAFLRGGNGNSFAVVSCIVFSIIMWTLLYMVEFMFVSWLVQLKESIFLQKDLIRIGVVFVLVCLFAWR